MKRVAARGLLLIGIACPLSPTDVRAQAPQEIATGDTVQLPPPPSEGARMVLALSGGWDTNALYVTDGPSDAVSDVGATLAYGKRGRHGVLGISGSGFRQIFQEYGERSIWRGTGALMAGWRPSRKLVLGFAAGVDYGYADDFVSLEGLMFPRTQALTFSGNVRLDYQLERRVRWLTDSGYDGIVFEAGQLTDTESGRLRSGLAWRMGIDDEASFSYRYLVTRWGTAVGENHSALLGWRHRLSREWALGIQPGVTFLGGRGGEGGEGDRLLVVGEVSVSRVSTRSRLAVSYRRLISPGYGFGQFQYSQGLAVTASVTLTSRVRFDASAALDRSRDPFDGQLQGRTEWAEMGLVATVHPQVDLVASYGYRHRQYHNEGPVESHRIGLAVTGTIESRRARTTEEPPR